MPASARQLQTQPVGLDPGHYSVVLAAGRTYDVHFDAPIQLNGYVSQTVNVANLTGPGPVVSAALPFAYELSGRVTNGAGAGIPGVNVTVQSNCAVSCSFLAGARTDNQGSYSTMVPAGTNARIFLDASGTAYTSTSTADMTFIGPTTFNQTLGP